MASWDDRVQLARAQYERVQHNLTIQGLVVSRLLADNMSERSAAKAMGVSYNTANALAQGRYVHMTFDTALRLSQWLDVSLDTLARYYRGEFWKEGQGAWSASRSHNGV